MPHVASDLKSHGLSRPQQQAAKQAYTSASPATTPFDSILDETTRPAPEPRTQRAADDNSPRAERGQRTKSADRPDRAAKSDDKAKPSDTDAPAQADAAVDTDDTGVKTKDAKSTDATPGDKPNDKTGDQATAADDIITTDAAQPTGETKPADAVAPMPVAVVIDPAPAFAASPANTTQAGAKSEIKADNTAIAATVATAATAATSATAKTDTTAGTVTTAGTAAKAATAVTAATVTTATTAAVQPDGVTADGSANKVAPAEAPPNALAALAAKPEKTDKAEKTDLKSDKKADADKKVASAQTTLKPTAALDPEATQAANAEPAKDTGAHIRAEAAANSHRGASADTANTAAGPDTTVAAKSPDLTPPPGLTVQAPTHSAPPQAVAAPIAVAAQTDNSEPAVPIAGVAFEITSKALSGRNQFDIRLDPPDLGRIHVRLDVDRDGNVITHMVADRTDTLDLLRKDTAGLERALQDAGLKTSDNSLQFSLRDQQANQQQRNGGGESAHVVIEDEQLAAIEPAQRNYARYNAPTGGLDIRV